MRSVPNAFCHSIQMKTVKRQNIECCNNNANSLVSIAIDNANNWLPVGATCPCLAGIMFTILLAFS